MSDAAVSDRFRAALLALLDETFEQVHGIYLDRGTSLFETLSAIPAKTASETVPGRCASIAAHVEHMRFYLDVLEEYMLGRNPGKVDWQAIWNTVEAVNPEEWQASQERLRAAYRRVRTQIENIADWSGENTINGALGIVVHTAYHLGEIRRALCAVEAQPPG
ncbi:MAG: hypothetical protein IT326_07925 [Anaerolineae bacterium]|nr:hypothetical protein [Anaerolineae bacterium]